MVGGLLELRADLADAVLPAVVPGDLRLAILVFPVPALVLHAVHGALRGSVVPQGDVEVVAGAIADFPLAEEARAGGAGGADDARRHGSRELQALEVVEVHALAMAVLVDQDEGVPGWRGLGLGSRDGEENGKSCNGETEELPHGFSPWERQRGGEGVEPR